MVDAQIEALIACTKKHGLTPIQFSDYYSFLGYLIEDCPKGDQTHISWEYTLDKNTFCPEILDRWQRFIENVSLFVDVSDKDDDVTVNV